MIATKWPLLLVTGEPVTEEQSSEILIRTNNWWHLGGNDRTFTQAVVQVAAEFGYPTEDEQRASQWKALESWREQFDILDLEYLYNSRIMSSWIGGPHGWCDWSGRIGCADYNIGKWPTSEEVTEEWRKIAETFPCLTLTAQCVDDEGAGRLCGEWRIHAGTVRYIDEPAERIAPQEHLSQSRMLWSVFGVGGERGVTLERLREAFEVVCR